MNDIPWLDQIIALLPIIGGIVIGIVGLLFGRWLERGRPHISLIGVKPGITIKPRSKASIEIEPETGTKLKSQVSTVQVSKNIVQLSEKFKWAAGIPINEEANPSELQTVFEQSEDFTRNSQKSIKKAEALLEDLNSNSLDITHRMGIMKQLFDDWLIGVTLMEGIELNELTLPLLGEGSSIPEVHPEVQRKPDPIGGLDRLIIEYPFLENRRRIFLYGRFRGPMLDVEEERRDSLVEMIKYCDCERLRNSLIFVIHDLRAQHEIACQLVENIQPLIQSSYWQIEVIAANGGERSVILSPHAVLITKGGHDLSDLPLTALEPESKDNKQKENTVDSKSAEPIRGSEARFAKCIVLEPQKATQITFLADLPDKNAENYSKLGNAYNAEILDCSILLKREDIRGWRGNAVTLRSPKASFGKGIEDKRKDEIRTLAHHTILWQKIIPN